MKHNKTIIGLFAVLMILTMVVAPVMAKQPSAGLNRVSAAADEGSAVYIIKLADPAVASYTGGIAGLAATSPQATGASRLDPRSAASTAYRQYLNGKHAEFLTSMRALLGRTVDVKFRYLNAINGMAVVLTPAEAVQVAGMDGVQFVEREVMQQLDTDVGPSWIGAPGIWDGNTSSGTATKGEGVIIGVLDTGINSLHPSFADVGDDGYDHTNPFGAGNYVGVCDPGNPDYDPTFTCNDKLIGAWDMVQDPTNDPNSPEDSDGHGSHTTSTAGGNVTIAGMFAPTAALTQTISGVAPHANIIAYDVCVTSCPTSATMAAVDQAITDTVDVINYSISGGDQPWSDGQELAFLDAFNAGVFVSASAGNSGPGAGTVAHTSPWVMTVAASTHNRGLVETLMNMSGGTSPPADMTGAGFTAGYGPALIVHADAYGDGQCLNPFPANTWTSGEIVVCDRGAIARVQKGANVLAGGAAGFVLANTDSQGESIVADPHFLPGMHVGDSNGDLLRAWLGAPPAGVLVAPMGTISGYTLDYSVGSGDVMADFSSRGPSQYDLLAPNVTAPGVSIWAAYCRGCTTASPDYTFLGGTSMSSPHDAGAAALMSALHPDWTPEMIMSAMMSTAYFDPAIVKEDGVTPVDAHDVGSGRLSMGDAGNAGFVLQETGANFLAADPNNSGDPRTLNVPNMVDQACISSCTFTRTISSTLPVAVTYNVMVDNPAGVSVTVTPSSFTLPANGTQTLVIDADTSSAGTGAWLFGNVWFEPDKNFAFIPLVDNDTSNPEPGGSNAPADFGPAVQHFPIILQVPPADINVTPTNLSATMGTNSTMTDTLNIANTGTGSLVWTIFEDLSPDSPLVDWSDNFDSYGTGVDLHGVGGWKGWGNSPGATAFTSAAQALSAPNSVDINTTSDLVHEYSGYTSGTWVYTAWSYVPGSFSSADDSFFILMNSYDDPGANLNWSTQVHFNGATGMIVNDGSSGGTMPYLTDQWVEIRVEIDLDSNTQLFFYNGALLFAGTWTEEMSGGGALNIGAVDLFANNSSSVFYDDLSLTAGTPTCSTPSDIPWLSVSPTGGTTAGGSNDDVTVTYDTTGLGNGSYNGFLCVSSNDPDESTVVVPVDLTVGASLPEIVVDPASMASSQAANTTLTQTLTISNTGTGPLTWDIDEDNSTAWSPPAGAPEGTGSNLLDSADANVEVPAGYEPESYNGSATVLLDQAPNQLTGLFADAGCDICGLGAQSIAENFTLSQAEIVYQIVIWGGYYPNDIPVADDFTVIFHNDAAGLPGGNVSTETSVPSVRSTTGVTLFGVSEYMITMTLSTPVNLTAGSYWIEIFNNTGVASDDFFWETGNPDTIGNGGLGSAWTPYTPGVAWTYDNTLELAIQLLGSAGGGAACDAPEDIPWLSLSPTSGTTPASSATGVEVTFDSTGLSNGQYDAALCVNSDDSNEPVTEVPVSLFVGTPNINVDPLSMGSTQATNTTVTQTLMITNTGTGALIWNIDEDNSPGAWIDGITVPDGTVPDAAIATSAPAGSFTAPDTVGTVLYDQTDFPGINSITSQEFGALNAPFTNQAADDFVVTDASGWTVDTVYVPGAYFSGPGLTPFVNVEFYADAAGSPGALVKSYDGITSFADDGFGVLTIDLSGDPAILPQGTYWVSVAADMDLVPGGQWGWTERTLQAGTASMWQNPPDGFGTGCTTWADRVSCGVGSDPDLLFSLSGSIGAAGTSCDAPSDIPWLSLDMTSGVTPGSAAVTVTYDSTGYSTGTYTAALCINSNDPDPGPGNGTDLVVVDVTMNVP